MIRGCWSFAGDGEKMITQGFKWVVVIDWSRDVVVSRHRTFVAAASAARYTGNCVVRKLGTEQTNGRNAESSA